MRPPSIRPATSYDSRFLSWAILTATRSHLARGWFDIALNRSEGACLDFLEILTTTSIISNWHYSRFLIAEDGGQPVSALSAFRAKDAYPLATRAMVEAMKSHGISTQAAAAIWTRGAYMFRCTIRPDDDCLVIDTLATLSAHRGKGYTSSLLSHVIDSASELSLRHAQVSVFIGNHSAERTYLKAGFHLEKERRDTGFEAISGAPGLRQYAMTL